MCARGIQIMADRKLRETQAEFLSMSRELQESKARLEEAQRVAHVGYWIWDLKTDRVTWSDETYRIYGLRPQKGPIDLATIRKMIHPEDRESVFQAAEKALLGVVRPDAEHRIVRLSGEVRTVHSQGDVKRDSSGRPYQCSVRSKTSLTASAQRKHFSEQSFILAKGSASLTWELGRAIWSHGKYFIHRTKTPACMASIPTKA